MVVDAKTGKKANSQTKQTIIESFKKNNLINDFDSRFKNVNILKFY